jgi:hypothetical protein
MAVYVAVAVLGAVVVLGVLAGWVLRGHAASWCARCGGAVGSVCGPCSGRAAREAALRADLPRPVAAERQPVAA